MAETAQLTLFGLTEREAQQALKRLSVRDVDYADLYLESTETTVPLTRG